MDTPANNNPFAPFIFELSHVKFHIKRLSYNFLQEANDSTEPFKSKLAILENCITRITVNDIEVAEPATGELLRELLSLDEFMQLCDICFYAQTLNEEQFLWLKMSAWNNLRWRRPTRRGRCAPDTTHSPPEAQSRAPRRN